MHVRSSHRAARRRDILSAIFGPVFTNSNSKTASFSAISTTTLSSASPSTSVSASLTVSAPIPTTDASSESTTSSSAFTSVYETVSGGQPHTVTTFVSSQPTASTTATPPQQSFLKNKTLSDIVFTVVGIAALAIIILIATFFVRRRRHNKLLREAISFAPVDMSGPARMSKSIERGSTEEWRTAQNVNVQAFVRHPAWPSPAASGGFDRRPPKRAIYDSSVDDPSKWQLSQPKEPYKSLPETFKSPPGIPERGSIW